eukprot:gene17811-biopygen12385
MLVGGASGGGHSTQNNIDYIAEQLPSSCDVRAWMNSGLFFDVASYPDFLAGNLDKYDANINKSDAKILNVFVDESCRAALGDDYYKGVQFDHAFPYITTPSLVSQAMFDQHQIVNDVSLPPGSLTENGATWSKDTKAYVAFCSIHSNDDDVRNNHDDDDNNSSSSSSSNNSSSNKDNNGNSMNKNNSDYHNTNRNGKDNRIHNSNHSRCRVIFGW